MYLFLFLSVLYVSVLGEPCITPNGQTGECVPLKSCSSLLWSFTNYKYGAQRNLRKYLCPVGELGIMVCCETRESLVIENKAVEPLKTVNAENCGIPSNIETDDGILHMQNFPWLVKIMSVNNRVRKERRIQRVRCTGVLINNWYVLYSAQCHMSLQLTAQQEPDVFARIDTSTNRHVNCSKDSYSPSCSDFEIFNLDITLPHFFFDKQTRLNDMAMLRLHRRADDSDLVRPICLPTSNEIVSPGETLYLAGWKKTHRVNDLSVKIIRPVTYISNEECQNLLLENGSNITLTSYEMCTSTEDTTSAIDDLGFPLMSLQNNRWYFQGFVSQGTNTKVYTRAQKYLQWIQGGMGGEVCYVPYDNKTIIGECMHLTHCPRLMDAFANASPKDESILRKFKCWYGNENPNNPRYPLRVCCNLKSNFTIPLEPNDKSLDYDVSDFRYCGLQHRDDYVLKDDTIQVDEFPWLAVILNASMPEQQDNICGGTLITNRYVITSAQCMSRFYLEDTMLVRLGDYDLKKSTDCVEFAGTGAFDCNDIQDYGIEKKIVHPFYNRYTFLQDIVLLRLNATVSFTDYVRPICLPRFEDDLAKIGDTLFTTGFGGNSRYIEGLKIKKKIRTTLISNQECGKKIKWLNIINVITPYQMCTKDISNFTDTICVGDEGGPIMHSKNWQWFMEGISFSFGCGDDEPQSFLKIFKYLKWIKLHVKNS